MSFKSHIPFYRQMSGILIFLFCFLFLIFSATAFLLYQRNTQMDELINVQIPQIEFTNKYNKLLRDNNTISAALPLSKSVEELDLTFQQLQFNIDKMSSLNSNSFKKINYLKNEMESINDIIKRVQGNDELNTLLKLTAVDQLDTLNKVLKQSIDAKIKEKSSLNQLISASGAYIYSGQANALIDSIRVIGQLNKIQDLLGDSLLQFEQLNISYSIEHFDATANQIDLSMQMWLSTLGTVKADRDTKVKIEELKKLLSTEERMFGKWHSHLRLSEEIFKRSNIVNEALNELNLVSKTDSSINTSYEVIPAFISTLANKVNSKLTVEQYNYILIGGLLLSLFLIALILIRVQFRLRRYGVNTVKLCQSLLSDNNKNEQGSFVQSSEHLRIVGLIQQVQKPDHSENQYQQLLHKHEEDSSFLANHHRLIHWRYIPGKEYIANNKDVLELCNVGHLYIVNWRQLFHKSSIKDVIAIAKTARDSNTTLSCRVRTNNDVRMDLLIDSDGKGWTGTIHRNDKIELLQGALAKTKSKLKTAEVNALEEVTDNTDKFSKMVLGAMLQSQGGSIDSVGASLQVYRQLTRVLDWCRQSKIVTQLQHSGNTTEKNNINFKNELHAVLLNAMSETYLQRNQIFLQADKQLMEFAQVDQRLFHRMLLGVIRISLAEQFNARMLFGLKVIDLDNGMQTVRFSLTVASSKPLKAIPELVNRLANEDRKATSSLDIIFYLRTLMFHLNINDIQTELYDDGFKLFFDARIQTGNNVESLKTLPLNTNLKHEQILLLSGCEFSQQVISEAVSGLGGVAKILNQVEDLKKQYPQNILEKRAVNLIIVGDDIFKDNLEHVEKYIDSLPANIQPKLMVMQAHQGAPLHKVGLYEQASTPLCLHAFQKQLVDLLQSSKKNNRLIEPEILSQFNYLPTRVEVLLAVSKPDDHQTLIRILQWLGMQVQIVCQPQTMTKHWQSGRFLVLISEFTQSPFVLVSTGRSLHRGVFTFKDMLFDTPEGIISNVVKDWKVSKLPNILDIKALTSLLEPWLKPDVALVTPKVSLKTPEPKVQKIQSYDEFLNENQSLNEEDKAYLTQSKLFLPDVSELPVDVVFDLAVYARNQGSSELASYMLDEYVQDIQEAIALVEEHINAKRFNDVLKPLSIISTLSDVMAATELNKKSIAFKTSLDKSIESGEIDSTNTHALKLLKHECERLIAFSEAI